MIALLMLAASPDIGSLMIFAAFAMAVIFCVVIVVLAYNVFGLWFQAMMSGAHIGIAELIAMRFRKVDVRRIVMNRIRLVKAAVEGSTKELESHMLSGGDVDRVTLALIAADRAGIELDFKKAAAIDLAGRDVLDAVQTSVLPKVIDVPAATSGRTTIDAVAGNGIQLCVRARVTVRTNIATLVGGATEETIIARVGEGIVSAIGSATTHLLVLENPDKISKAVLGKGLDAGTAYEILSIDIADVDVGENIGAKLKAEQAEADKRMAQAEAEKRRAMAIAHEQEMKAKVQENRAVVVLAEAEIPKAMAEALRGGKLGVMDYYNMQNVQADTHMRQSIAGEQKPAAQA